MTLHEWPRNLHLERLRTQIPAEMVFGITPHSLIRFAEQRAGDAGAGERAGGGILCLPYRDFGTEAREEGADYRNYLVWWRMQVDTNAPLLIANGVDVNALRAAIDHALAGIAYAFEHTERARILQGLERS